VLSKLSTGGGLAYYRKGSVSLFCGNPAIETNESFTLFLLHTLSALTQSRENEK